MTVDQVSQKTLYETIILANGEMPTHPLSLHLLSCAKQIICCDGAIEHLLQLNIEPTAVVGDCDSISEENKTRFKHILYPDKDEEYNDLNKALRFCLRRGIYSVAILGGFGLREDHALGNLGVMIMFAEKEQMTIEMVTNQGVFTPIFKTTTLSSFPGQQISIFGLTEESRFTFHQLKYPVKQKKLEYLWEGTLNEALSDSFTVEFEKGKALIYRGF